MTTCATHGNRPEITCATCHAAALATEAAQTGRVAMASQVVVDVYAAELAQILEAVGHPEALITDLTCVDDFGAKAAHRIRRRLGVEAAPDDYLVEVARRLREGPGSGGDA